MSNWDAGGMSNWDAGGMSSWDAGGMSSWDAGGTSNWDAGGVWLAAICEGDGCSVDCVVADFISGAAEHLILANQHHDILVFEGQGSLYHPSYSGVTLGLLHGSQPDGLILCYEVGRTGARGMSHVPLPSLAEAQQFYELAARAMHPCRVIGVAMNSSTLTEAEADAEGQRVTTELQLPACDVFRHGPQPLADAVLNLKAELGK